MKSSMIRPVRTEAGLGNPPTEFSTKDVEAANFMVKYGLHFDPQKPHVFIESVKDVIETQYRNEDRAVFGKGPYRLKKGFEHFLVNDLKWSSMTAVQRQNKVKEFQKADVRSRKDYVTITAPAAPQCSTLSVTAIESGIIKRPSTTSLVDLLEYCNDQHEQSSNQNDVPPMQISTAYPVNHIVSNNALYQPPIIQQNYQQTQVQRNNFFLKWIAGTTVSKCHDCREKIQNPPKLTLDDLLMAYKDIHQFRDPVTGVLRYSDAPQNVHFHLRSFCARTRYPNFSYTWLDVPLQMQQSLSLLHFQILLSEFHWRP